MDIDKIVLYVIIGAFCIFLITFLVIKIVKFAKMSKDEKIKLLKTYLKGIISLAEQEIVGDKRGDERLKMVEDYFNKKAPKVYKIVLLLLGKDNLKQFIESSLEEIKQSFGG